MTEGIVNVLKPPGLTSSDVVCEIRKIFSMKRVGHTGTLDPGAAGVLPVCLGRATRLFDILVDKKKTYIADIAFGCSTDTQDAYGRITGSSDAIVTNDIIKAALPAFLGDIVQQAPMYSAVSVNGQRLYKLARSGAETEPILRNAHIDSIQITGRTAENCYLIELTCSRGTYVRAIADDLGKAVGVPAHMRFLLRTRSGAFGIDGAYTLDELRAMKADGTLDTAVVSVEHVLSDYPEVRAYPGERNTRLLTNGASIPWTGHSEPLLRVYCHDRFLGIGCSDGETLRMDTFFGAEGVHDDR